MPSYRLDNKVSARFWLTVYIAVHNVNIVTLCNLAIISLLKK